MTPRTSPPRFPELPPIQDQALREIVAWIITTCEPLAIIACGSIIRGEGDPASDLDMQVIHDQPWRQRLQRFSRGVPCEILINPLERLQQYLQEEQARGRPSTAHMLATGFVVLDPQGVTGALLDSAREHLGTPPSTTPQELVRLRYHAVDAVENAQDLLGRDLDGAALLAGAALQDVLTCYFLGQGRHLPRAKDLVAAMAGCSPELHAILVTALRGDPRSRVLATRDLAQRCLGVSGFFPWESDREPC